ncbi:MAG TPA: hypothetical protein VJH33_00045 [Candidatus Paceibacterota bacterium]
MKRLTILAALCGIFFSDAAMALECKAPTEPYTPVWKVGDKWEYKGADSKDTVREVKEVTADGYVFESKEKGNLIKVWTSKQLNFIRSEVEGVKVKWEPHSADFPTVPFAVGVRENLTASKHIKYILQQEQQLWSATMRFAIKEFKEVQTPAGAFCAFRIERRAQETGRSVRTNIWFAPDVGNIVLLEVSRNKQMVPVMTLQSFRSGKQK